MRSAIVLVVDRLGAGFLGPYGNTWVDTPELNRLASQSVLVESAIADTPQLELLYRSYWHGTHALRAVTAAAPLLPALPAAAADIPATLLTDDRQLATIDWGKAFRQRIAVSAAPASAPANGVEETQLGQFFAAALDWLSQSQPPFLLWLHARGMAGEWDAPPEFRERFRDEDDPPPPQWIEPPDRQLARDYDPDELLGVTHAYAGQLAALDTCVGALLDAITESPALRDALLVLTSPRGYALGEHGRIGPCGDELHGEVLHTPLLLRFPDGRHAGERVQALAQPGDIYPTVLEWLGVPLPAPADWGHSLLEIATRPWLRDGACSSVFGQRSIRTPVWFLRETEAGNALYAKPDDRWEVNEIGNLCPEVVSELSAAIHQFAQSAESGQLAVLPRLSPLAREGIG